MSEWGGLITKKFITEYSLKILRNLIHHYSMLPLVPYSDYMWIALKLISKMGFKALADGKTKKILLKGT